MLKEHIGLVASIGLFLVVAVKVYRVAGSDVGTAAAVIQAGGPFSVTLGAVLAALPSIISSTGVCLFVVAHLADGPLLKRLCITTSVVCALLLVFVGPWHLLVFTVVALFGGIGMAEMTLRWKRKRESKEQALQPEVVLTLEDRVKRLEQLEKRIHSGFAWIIVLQLLSFTPLMIEVLSPQPWMPAEKLTRANGASLVGYVVADNTLWSTILVHEDRSLMQLRSESIESRQPCYATKVKATRSMWQVMRGKPAKERYETCWKQP